MGGEDFGPVSVSKAPFRCVGKARISSFMLIKMQIQQIHILKLNIKHAHIFSGLTCLHNKDVTVDRCFTHDHVDGKIL